jgi:pre-rRNA-processing protein TSR4
MYLVFQGYVPLENSIYHRAMYVWACNRRICIKKPGSIKALRAHLVDPEYLKQQQRKEAARLQKEEQLKAAQKRNAFVASPNGSPFQVSNLFIHAQHCCIPGARNYLVLQSNFLVGRLMVVF